MSSVYSGNFSQIAGSYADTAAVYSKSETTKTDETSGKKKVSGQTIGNPQLHFVAPLSAINIYFPLSTVSLHASTFSSSVSAL